MATIQNRLLKVVMNADMNRFSHKHKTRMFAPTAGWERRVRDTCHFMWLIVRGIMNDPVNTGVRYVVPGFKLVANGSHVFPLPRL